MGAKKDPNAPKKNQNSYIHFGAQVRERIKKKMPNLSLGDMSKQISMEFKQLSAEERKKWDDIAKKDKERYQREMKEYEQTKVKKEEAQVKDDTSTEEEES